MDHDCAWDRNWTLPCFSLVTYWTQLERYELIFRCIFNSRSGVYTKLSLTYRHLVDVVDVVS